MPCSKCKTQFSGCPIIIRIGVDFDCLLGICSRSPEGKKVPQHRNLVSSVVLVRSYLHRYNANIPTFPRAERDPS
eukprot:XP_001708574.1 Hypothetical protein GL50803_102442 [Giardia lamblia ATCC 50803]